MSSEEILARKIKVRTGHRGSATRLITQAETAVTAEPPNSADLELAIANLNRKLEVLTPLDAEILELTPDDIETEIDHADQYQENIQRTLSKLNKALHVITAPTSKEPPHRVDPPPSRSPPTTTPPGSPISSDHPTGEPPTPPVRGTKVKLPKLTLPHFNGNLTKWTAFWDSYESAIHSNDELSEVDKFNYLRSLLEGPAFEAVRGLTLSSANYQEAISILKKRFGNRQLIVSKHMETLLNIDSVASDQNVRRLRKLYNDVEANTRSLKALGIEPESYGAMFSSVLLGKLPNELRLIVSRKTSETDLTLSTLQHILEEELMARERTVNPRELPRARANSAIVLRSPHVQRPQPCFPALRQVLPAVTVNNHMHRLIVLLTSMKYRLGEILSRVDAALTAQVS